MLKRLLWCLPALWFAISSVVAMAGSPVTVAVASNFASPMAELARAFREQSGYDLKLSYGSSGKLYAQIVHGAPYSLFFSADQDKPSRLVAEGLATSASRETYACGRLALWGKSPSANALKDGSFNRLALANPKLAPYGYAAVEVLQAMGLATSTRAKWVIGENIAQAYQYVHSGNAELGFIALSQLDPLEQAQAWLVPETLYSPIRQDVVTIKAFENSVSNAFLEFLHSETAQEIIQRYGYYLSCDNRQAS